MVHDRGVSIKMQIWDTAGEERYRALAKMYSRDVQYVILMYSIIDDVSFAEVDHWYSTLRENCPVLPVIYLCGNKIDLENDRKVSMEEGKEKADSIGVTFYEMSCKEDGGFVDSIFMQIAQDFLQTMSPEILSGYPPPQPNDQPGCNC
jgi:small GTP-binding protein